MKKTKKPHYWQKRTRILGIFLCLFIVGMIATPIIQSKASTFQNISWKNAAAGGAIAFTPFALVAKMKTAGKWDALDENTKTYITSLETELNTSFNSIKDGNLTIDAIKGKYDEWMKEHGKGLTAEQIIQFTEMTAAVKAQAIVIEKLKDNGLSNQEVNNVLKALKEKFEAIKSGTQTNFKDYMGQSGRKGFIQIEIKAGGADQAAADIATHTIGLRVSGIGQIPVRKPFMTDLFATIPCSLEYIKYVDQETVVRDAQNVASAAPSIHTTKLTWKERSIQIVNIRDLIDVPIDMLQDYDFVQGEIENLLNVNVALKKDSGLLTGDGVAPNLHSVSEVASEFSAANTIGGTITPWAGTIQAPNIFDLVMVMASQIVALGQDGAYMPNVVLFNTIDRYKALLIKDKFNNYLMPPFVVRVANKDYNIDGMIVRSNPNVPANSVWVFDSTKGTIYQRKTALAEMSYENASNFETEVVTLKVYERLNLLIRNVNKNAFMKCMDVATALAALNSGV